MKRPIAPPAADIHSMRIAAANPVPVLTHGDVLVVEATLAGCVTAWLLAQQGGQVVLTATATSLAQELIVVRQPWMRSEDWRHLPDSFQEAFRRSVETTLADGELLLNLARLAVELEDLLLDGGVRLFYGLSPCGVRKNGHHLDAVIFGGKAGLHAISARKVIDAHAAATVTRLAGATLTPRLGAGEKLTVHLAAKVRQMSRPGPVAITRGQISDDRLEPVDETTLAAPGVDELVDHRVRLHGPYAQITLRLPVDVTDPLWLTRLSVVTRQSLVRIGTAVQQQRLHDGRKMVYFHRFSGGLALGPVLRIRSAAKGRPYAVENLDNLWVCGPAGDVSLAVAQKLAEPFAACSLCPALVKDVLAASVSSNTKTSSVMLGQLAPGHGKPAGNLRFADAPALHALKHVALPEHLDLPVLDQSEVLVVGGGTSGVPCALAAAGASARTTVLDQHADLGGVRTIGGVGSYWFGKPTPFQKTCDDRYDEITRRSGVAEEVSMMQCLLDAGVTVLAACPVAGVVATPGQILGVVVITPGGLAVVSGKMVVDATGDADLAAWAGAPFEYGNGRDALTLWGSFGNFNHEKRTCNRQYESTIEIRDPWDFTRNIVRGRRRPGMWRNLKHEMPQHYLTPRETRRILADATVTYSGILAGETFADVMIVCESNFDIKGIATSGINRCGVVSSWDVYEKFEAAVPWRAVQPRGLSNVLVAGRAYGASHDAISLARMQRDMVSLGGAVGLAAAQAARLDIAPGRLDVKSLQADWLALGVIQLKDFKRYAKPQRYTAQDASRDCQGLLARRGRWNLRLARLMRTPLSLPALQQAFHAATHEMTKVRIARALCYLGDAQGVAFLLESIGSQTAKVLPGPLKKHLAVPPEHGWAGEPVYSLHAISFSGAAHLAVEVMSALARKVEDSAERFGSHTESQFEYVLALCAVAECHPSSAMVAPLDTLYRRHCLRNLALPWGRDMRFTIDPVLERRAYLELCIGRALARCGQAQGYEILSRYSDDMRGTLARSASDELTFLLGHPWPADAASRHRLLADALKQPRMQPYAKSID